MRLNKLNTLKNKLVNASGAYPQNMFISQVSYLFDVVNDADQIPGRDVFEEDWRSWKKNGFVEKEFKE
ncbi:MAG: hypothetical protein R2788_14510 [Saprospiraceae bacterium]